ncbi:hypothetical protein Cgig2_028298 [Carnegiea gigantea]|uniref:Beta-fructofuranosidase n=1 Tax=Carnegiea gigantea TaxID=171969 RepID=A0A9Q1GU89_9CARY|nr:hypothetical protein Cgig2_028298 [Carnegiea gigantea]
MIKSHHNHHHPKIKFIIKIVFGFLICLNNKVENVEASHKVYPRELQSVEASRPVNPRHRTAFHFQPPSHWINGPMYYKGLYHLFYQYNPKGSIWGNIVWGHSVSTDLINWKVLKPAIHKSKPFDKNGAWSGSATILHNRPVILYTGLDAQNKQVQNIAFPANESDPLLQDWVKPDYNPIITASSGMNATAFRDPTTAWWSNGHWKIVVGGRKRARGIGYLYRSRDFKKWYRAKHPLHSAPKTGMWECPDFFPVLVRGQNGLDTYMTGENVKYVFKVSLDVTRFEYYTIGTYDPHKDRYYPDKGSFDGWDGLRYDYGNFYASKSFFDPKKGRRILWGWVNESSTILEDILKGWSGIQGLPRAVWLDRNGKQLIQWPVEEVETLRDHKVQLSSLNLSTGTLVEVKGITPAQLQGPKIREKKRDEGGLILQVSLDVKMQADVVVTFTIPSLEQAEAFDSNWTNPQQLCAEKGSTVAGGVGPFGLLTLASANMEEYTPVFYRVFKAPDKYVVLMCSDAKSSSLDPQTYKPSFASFVDADLSDKKLSLRTLIDHSVVESFGEGGKTCITSRVYPTLAVMENAHLHVFNVGTQTVIVDDLNAYSMKKPLKMNN